MLTLRKITASLLFVFFLLTAKTGLAQSITITGKVFDDQGKPLAGATVVGKATAGISTTADDNGVFSIAVPRTLKSLVVSSVGYAEQEVPIRGRFSITVTMQSDAKTLNDVVVVGYGTARKKDITGAVASVAEKDFSPGVINNPLEQIQGKVAGLVITKAGGDPNSNLIIRLRGQTSLSGGQTPLIVVDGIQLDDPNQISNIPASDIASYDVLKDVSATAIYGSRGANGVIIINTKKGAAGRTRVEYNGYVGADVLAKNLNLLSASEWRKALAADPTFDASTIASFDKGANTDWLKEMTRTAVTQSHNIAVTGGTGGFNYRASVNYMNQQGIVINSGKQQLGFRFNGEQKALNDKLDIQVSLFSNKNNRKYVDYNVFDYINTTPPTYPVHNPDGTYYGYYDYDQQNPVAQQMLETNDGTDQLTQLWGKVDYKLLAPLTIGVQGSTSTLDNVSRFFQPDLPGVGNINNGYQSDTTAYSKKGDFHINFNKSFGKHRIDATGVYEYNDYTNSKFTAAGQQFLVPSLGVDNLSGGNPALNVISSYKEEFKIVSFLGRIAYNYDSRYYATISFRRDGSSKFGVNNRWGNFPSASIAWRIKGEEFMKNVSWLDELKLNAGIGVVGNQDAISPYNTILTLGGSTRYYNPSNSTYLYPQSYTPNQNANPDLRWEERHGANVGLTFAMLGNRINGNLNYFSDKTEHLLFNYNVPTPPFFVNNILANVGTLTNKGFEAQLNGDLVRTSKFTWNVGGQITFVKTRITSLDGSYAGYKISTDDVPVGYALGRGYAGNVLTYLKKGYAPYVFDLPRFAGLAQAVDPSSNSNQLYYKDDGTSTPDIAQAATRYIDPSPKFTYGINSTLTYDNIGLNFFLRGVSGQKIYNNYQNVTSNYSRLPGNNITREGLTNGIRGSQTVSDKWLENGSYLRLDNITLSYTFKKMAGLDNLRVYVTGSNLFVITPYHGIDPEVKTGDTPQAYIDNNVYGDAFYPRSRTILFGVNVAFK